MVVKCMVGSGKLKVQEAKMKEKEQQLQKGMTRVYVDGSTTEYCWVAEGFRPTLRDGLPKVTNNEGEYRALIRTLLDLIAMGMTNDMELCLDSELVVNQLNGKYAVREPRLRPYFDEAQRLLSLMGNTTVVWIPREKNRAGKILG